MKWKMILMMLKKIKQALAVLKLKPNLYIKNTFTNTVQEDTKDKEVIKRINKHLDDQMELINARALKPHSCKDPVGCTKDVCWKFEPDKIVSESYEIKR
jgi:hypothetical protein